MNATAWMVLRTGLTAGLAFYAISQVDMDVLRQRLLASSPGWLLIALFLTVATLLLGVSRWAILLRSTGASLSWGRLAALSYIGLFLNTFVPGNMAGDVARGLRSAVETRAGVDSMASVVLDRMLGLLGLLIMAAIGAIFTLELFQGGKLWPYLLVSGGLLLGGIVVVMSRRISRRFRWAGRLLGGFYDTLRSFILSVQAFRARRMVLLNALLITFAGHVMMTASVYCAGQAVGATPGFLYYLLLVPVINLISSLPITLGGLGIREAGFIILFTQLGASAEQSTAISLLYFFLIVVNAMAGGLMMLTAWGKQTEASTTPQRG